MNVATPTEAIDRAYDEQIARIKDAMTDRNMRKVAEACGLHENTLYNALSGKKRPSPATLDALSAYLFPSA